MVLCIWEWPNQAVYVFAGALYPTSMRINGQGRLVVNFRTEARFRGLFVSTHPGTVYNAYFF